LAQDWKRYAQNERLWEAIFRSKAEAAISRSEATLFKVQESKSDDVLTLETLQSEEMRSLCRVDFTLSSWREACLANVTPDLPNVYRWNLDNKLRFVCDPRSLSLKLGKMYDEISGHLRIAAGLEPEFACSDTILTNPEIYIPELDLHLDYPVPVRQIRQLIDILGSRAPFGRGQETVVDLSVRKCWEIPASRFVTANPKWAAMFTSSLFGPSSPLACVRNTLLSDNGIDQVVATPYKLLIYEKGDFFHPHVDTQRCPAMFGTLTVSLLIDVGVHPFQESLGILKTTDEISIRHLNQEKKFNLSCIYVGDVFGSYPSLRHRQQNLHMSGDDYSERYAKEAAAARWVAFYTDCVHELKPLNACYRLSLVYHLHRVASCPTTFALSSATTPEVGDQKPTILRAARSMGVQFACSTALFLSIFPNQAAAWLLDYKYARCISNKQHFQHLKGTDAMLLTQVRQLFAARIVAEPCPASDRRSNENLLLLLVPVLAKKMDPVSTGFTVTTPEHYGGDEGYWSGTYDGKVLWMNPQVLDRDRAFDRTESFYTGNEHSDPDYLYERVALFLVSANRPRAGHVRGKNRYGELTRFDMLQTISQKN